HCDYQHKKKRKRKKKDFRIRNIVYGEKSKLNHIKFIRAILIIAIVCFIGSKRISDSEVSDYDCDDGIGIVSDYRHNGRDLQSSTLSVPEQVMSSNHCSPSGSPHRVDVIGRTRSWSPSVPPPQSRNVEQGLRGTRSTAGHYNTISRMDRHRVMDDRYSPDRDSHFLTLPRSRYSQNTEHHHRDGRDCEAADRQPYHRSRSTEQRPLLERTTTRSRSTERPDTNLMRSMPSLMTGRSAPPSPALSRSHPRTGSVQTSPSSTPVAGRRGRQLPQLPPKGTLERNNGVKEIEPYEEVTWEDQQKKVNGTISDDKPLPKKKHQSEPEEVDSTRRRHAGAMDIEERNRQMKINKYKQVAGSDPRLEQDYHSKYRSGWDPHRGADNISTKSSDSDVSDISAVSRTSSASRFSSTSYMSVQSERPRGNKKISVFTSKMQSRQMGISGKNLTKSTSISGDMCSLDKTDGSQSDTAVGALGTSGKKRRSSIGAKMVAIVGLSRKSRSASQLSQTGSSRGNRPNYFSSSASYPDEDDTSYLV
uniref:regulating synaptic membrane exocytosis protein 2-like n=1 Tax=Halichoerus grypus TaxID=9711 RepID=UPI001658FF62